MFFDVGGTLSDNDIRSYIHSGLIKISSSDNRYPFSLEGQIQTNAIDFHVGRHFGTYNRPEDGHALRPEDVKDDSKLTHFTCTDDSIRLEPGHTLLGLTREVVTLDKRIMGLVFARNGIGRLGMLVNCMAPIIKPGHDGAVPLQLVNLNRFPIEILFEEPICQIMFIALLNKADKGYNEHKNSYAGERNTPRRSGIFDETHKKMR